MENSESLENQAQKRVGTTVGGKYRLDALIALGGMAAVYAGRHRAGNVVAIKCLHERFARDGDALRWFKREAYVSNQVGHERALAVLDDETDGEGAVFLVMPLLEGETVAARWKRLGRRLPISEVIAIGRDALDVLASAHAKGIVHRDIKPENLFLTTAAALYVLDFGIARVRDGEPGITATRTGMVVGTPTFMAPEQARGRAWEVSPRTDVWAVGATLFTLLSGAYVHEGETASEVSAFAATRPARKLAEVAPEVPVGLADVIDRALLFDASARWSAAGDMRDAWMGAVEAARLDAGPPVPRGIAQIRTMAPRVADFQDAPTANPLATRTGLERAETELAAERPLPRAKRVSSRAFAIVVASGAVLALGAYGVRLSRFRAATSPTTPPVVNADAGRSGEALALLKAGKQLLRDASYTAGEKMLTRALELDSSLASAHLALASAPGFDRDNNALHVHYTKALELRALLDESEKGILSSLGPVYSTPPDWELATARARTNLGARPADVDAAQLVLQFMTAQRRWSDAIHEAERLLPLFPDSPRIHRQMGRAEMFVGKHEEARRELRTCTTLAPAAVDCILDLVRLDADTGRCVDSEAGARKLISLDPDTTSWSAFLAQAEFANTASIDVARAALHAASELPPDAGPMQLEPEYECDLAFLQGDFERGLRELDVAEAAQHASGSSEYILEPLERHRFQALIELGNVEAATAAARQFLARRTAWTLDSVPDFEIVGWQALHLAGALSRTELNAKRDAWSLRMHATPNELWESAYLSQPPQRLDDANDVLAHEPKGTLAVTPFVGRLGAYGEALRIAGRESEALALLTRVAHNCRAVLFPIEQTQANLHLGRLLEARGDRKAACDAYRVVVARWGAERRSRSAQEARAAIQRLGCAITR